MKFATENLTPPTAYYGEALPSDAEMGRKQAEIARCLSEFREKWSALPPKEITPLAEVIPINGLPAGPVLEQNSLLSSTG